MSSDMPFTKENLNAYLKELGKEFRKRNGTKTPAEIILIGGAAILAGYGFREMTYDIDAIIRASSAMKEAVNHVGDRLGLPSGWLNMDFQNTAPYTDKLPEINDQISHLLQTGISLLPDERMLGCPATLSPALAPDRL